MLVQGSSWDTATILNNGGTGSGTLDNDNQDAWFIKEHITSMFNAPAAPAHDTEDGNRVSVRQSTEAEDELAATYSLLEVTPNPIGKAKSLVPLKAPPKKSAP